MKTIKDMLMSPADFAWTLDIQARLSGYSTTLPGADGEDFYTVPLDSVVGRQCLQLFLTVELIRTLQVESDDFDAIRQAAVNTMLVWYFG